MRAAKKMMIGGIVAVVIAGGAAFVVSQQSGNGGVIIEIEPAPPASQVRAPSSPAPAPLSEPERSVLPPPPSDSPAEPPRVFLDTEYPEPTGRTIRVYRVPDS